MKRLVSGRLWVVVAALAMMIAACGGNDGASGSDGVSHQDATPEELEIWQTDLNAVGCYVGPVDGSLGPQTESAIKAFQAAKGLTVDGLLGPQTEGALTDAVAAGEIVCGESGDTTATLSSSGYGPVEFNIGSCSSSGESDIELQAQVDNMTLLVDASEADRSEAGGAGTLSVDGGTESDGITLNGRVESISVGDTGDFTVTGLFGPPNNDGEEFTLTGSCA